ncbi:MAG: hypothetical protein AAF614_39350 [Chloroflexota bacterium]
MAETTVAETAVSATSQLYLPTIKNEIAVSPPPPLAPPTRVTVNAPPDFAQIRADLQAQGQDLAFSKLGFHVGAGGNRAGLEEMLRALDNLGIPFFLKSASNAEPIYIAQQMMAESGVPHTLVYRTAAPEEVPPYHLAPAVAAAVHWEFHKEAFPPELDPSVVWIETINEVDKNRSEWLAEFSIEMAKLTMADGFRWATFGWSSGEPEPEHWEGPMMLEWLRLAGQHPDRLAIALHEYSYRTESISHAYPYLVGRFQKLFMAADKHNIPRPTVLITEWGWEYQDVPDPEEALKDIAWASWLYAAYPEVKGAAIWYLGPGFSDIDDQTQRLIDPVGNYSAHNYFVIDPGFGSIAPELFTPNSP